MRIKDIVQEGEVIHVDFNPWLRDREQQDPDDLDSDPLGRREDPALDRQLKKLAAFWHFNNEDPAIERRLARMGWEIGYSDSWDEDDPEIFVTALGDHQGISTRVWWESELYALESVTEVYPTDTVTVDRSQPFNMGHLRRLQSLRKERLPSGFYGSVSATKDPGTVIKSLHSVTDTDSDGFHIWIKAVQNLHQRGVDNAYFPAVYEIKLRRDSLGQTRPQYQLQSLKTLDELPLETIKAIVERLFDLDRYGNYDLQKAVDLIDRDGWDSNERIRWRQEHRTKYDLTDGLVDMVRLAYKGAIQTEDEELARALKYLKALYLRNQHTVRLDLHSGNFLARLGPGGAQLVIADPFSDHRVGDPEPWRGAAERRKELEQRARDRRAPKPVKTFVLLAPVQSTPVVYPLRTVELKRFTAQNRLQAESISVRWQQSQEGQDRLRELKVNWWDVYVKEVPEDEAK